MPSAAEPSVRRRPPVAALLAAPLAALSALAVAFFGVIALAFSNGDLDDGAWLFVAVPAALSLWLLVGALLLLLGRSWLLLFLPAALLGVVVVWGILEGALGDGTGSALVPVWLLPIATAVLTALPAVRRWTAARKLARLTRDRGRPAGRTGPAGARLEAGTRWTGPAALPTVTVVLIRAARDEDWAAIHPVFAAIVAEGRTYAYPEQLPAEAARALWMEQPPGRTVVAVEGGSVLGTAKMGPNRPGRGAHIATASFMVDPARQARGVGRALGEHVVQWARDTGHLGIQFNAVVETNHVAVHLWQSLGFDVLATVPRAFDHREHGLVGLHLMFCDLTEPSAHRH